MTTLLFLCFPGYLIAQFFAFRRLRGGWLWVAVLPATVMSLVVLSAAVGFSQGSPQWPLLVLFLSPLALFFTLALVVVHAIAHPNNDTMKQ